MTAQSDDDTSPPPPPPINFVDVPLAPDVFADGACGFFVRDGVIKITFFAAHVDHNTTPGPVNNVVIGRLVMSVSGAQHLAVGLYDFLVQRGLAPGTDPKKSN
jgi:hypothetical protein